MSPTVPQLDPPSDIGWPVLDDTETPDEPTQELFADLLEQKRKLTEELKRAKHHISQQDKIIDISQAQLVVQHLHLKKQNEALHEKERKKNEPHGGTRLLMDGMPRVLTGDVFVEKVQAAKAHTQEKKRQKEARIGLQAERKVAVAANEARWEDMKADHEREVVRWKAECERLASQNVLKKNLPKKLVRPRKPKVDFAVVSEVAEDVEEGAEGETSDDSDVSA